MVFCAKNYEITNIFLGKIWIIQKQNVLLYCKIVPNSCLVRFANERFWSPFYSLIFSGNSSVAFCDGRILFCACAICIGVELMGWWCKKITGPPLVMCDPVIQLSLLCELPYSAITRLYANISRTFCQSTNGRRIPSSNRIGQPSAQSSIYILACTLTDEVHEVCSGFSFTA